MTGISRKPVAVRDRSGGENLEVMQEAERYNGYLRELVRRYAGNSQNVLDFGAGIGTFSDSTGTAAERVYCVEPDPKSRSVLSAKGFNAVAELSLVGGASMDYVFSLNVLEHIEDDAAAVKDIFRVLRPGGRLFLYLPAFGLLYTSMDRHVGHFRRYRLSGVARLLNEAGFEIRKKAYADALGFFATLAFKVFDKPEPAPLSSGLVRLYDRHLFPLSRVLSVPLARILGKNLYVVAERPQAKQ